MSVTLTIRIPKELKERMKKINVNWSEEVRKFLERRVAQLEAQQILEDIERRAVKRKVKVDSTMLIREDRCKR